MTELRSDSTFDRVLRWIVLVLATLGAGMYTVGVVTEWERLGRDIWEDGIVLGFSYAWITFLGVLSSIVTRMPRFFLTLAALANALVAGVLVMLWVGLFMGDIDRGAEFLPPLITVVYFLLLRAIRMREHFRPPVWMTVLMVLSTSAYFVLPDVLKRRAQGLQQFDDAATIMGAVQIVTGAVWVAFLIFGFARSSSLSKGATGGEAPPPDSSPA